MWGQCDIARAEKSFFTILGQFSLFIIQKNQFSKHDNHNTGHMNLLLLFQSPSWTRFFLKMYSKKLKIDIFMVMVGHFSLFLTLSFYWPQHTLVEPTVEWCCVNQHRSKIPQPARQAFSTHNPLHRILNRSTVAAVTQKHNNQWWEEG